MSQLIADCLNAILEFLEEDKATLYSCLLVNHLWCEVSVRILWKDIWDERLSLNVINTLITCLPTESKKRLRIVTLNSNPPLFNYASFCKVLSIRTINILVVYFLRNQSRSMNKKKDFIQEIIKMFMNQSPSLKKLTYCLDYTCNFTSLYTPNDISLIGTMDCLKDLSELSCNSDVHSEFFYQLSQICHNIKSLDVKLNGPVPNELRDLISSQNGLKNLTLAQNELDGQYDIDRETDLMGIVPSLTKHSSTITKLCLYKYFEPFSLSFITKFTNLEELDLWFDCEVNFTEYFDDSFQYTTFPQLQILKLYNAYPEHEAFYKFLENNGKNLKELHMDYSNSVNSFNLTIAKFCPNLKSLCTHLTNNEMETLKLIFKSCQQLESIKIYGFKNTKKLLKFIVKYSPENFHELGLLSYDVKSESFLKELESFLICWKDRTPQKSFSFDINFGKLKIKDKNIMMEIVEKYKKMGIIKNFNYNAFYCS